MVETLLLILFCVVFSGLALRFFGMELNPFGESDSSDEISPQVAPSEKKAGEQTDCWKSQASVSERGKGLSFGSVASFLILLLIGGVGPFWIL